jgi:hypothetical protein
LKVIQTINDIEYLKSLNNVPLELFKAIEQDLVSLIEEEAVESDPLAVRLPFHKASILLENGDEVSNILGDTFHLEYVEKLIEGNISYYRIAKRHDHEFQLIYTLIGCHDEEVEKWLEEQVE